MFVFNGSSPFAAAVTELARVDRAVRVCLDTVAVRKKVVLVGRHDHFAAVLCKSRGDGSNDAARMCKAVDNHAVIFGVKSADPNTIIAVSVKPGVGRRVFKLCRPWIEENATGKSFFYKFRIRKCLQTLIKYPCVFSKK